MSRLLMFSARSRSDLARILLATESAALPAPVLQSWQPRDPYRFAIVAETAEQLRTGLERGADAVVRGEDGRAFALAGSIFFARIDDHAARGKTAFLFPGFGVKRTRLLADLVELFPFVEQWLDGLGEARGGETDEPAGDAARAPTTMMDAVLLGDLAMWVVLRQVGLTCDDMAGHSFGENAVLVASGMVDHHWAIIELLRRVSARTGPLMEETSGGLGMLALSATSRPAVEPFLTSRPPRAFISLDNCPNQMVVWGKQADLAELEQLVRARREVVFRLPELDQPVHTPFFPLPLGELRGLYENIVVRAARVPAWSAATVERFPDDPAKIRDVLAGQWLSPVRFRELVQRLYDEGTTTFVEVGPGDRLSGFVRNTLRGASVVTAATNMEGRATLTQLHIALAQLFVRGHDFDATRIETLPAAETPVPRARTPSASRTSSQSAVESSEQRRRTETLVAAAVAEVLGDGTPALLDPDRGLFEMGLGSIGCLELVERLERALDRSIPQTWPFDYPTIRRLAAALEAPSAAPWDPSVARDRTRASDENRSIAIVGIGCRFPGGADSPGAFFRLLMEGRDTVGPVPSDRWQPAALDPQADAAARQRESFGAFLDDIRTFDAGFFGISPRETIALDPQQRLLLEVTWEALEHAAIDPASLAGSAAGVFIGISNTDYAARLSMHERLRIGGYLATGNAASTAAGRIAFFLGLQGPCVALDTACSSSLSAVHQACESLRRGDSHLALAGGVNLLINPETTIFLSHALALSPTGRCRTFDAAADGYVRGEGCGMVVLKRLQDAVAAGDRVLAVIRGTAMNHDGRTSGLTVPNGLAQEAVVRQALEDADCAPDAVDYVEAHGTGTPLGDPIEINALGRVFGARASATRKLRLGSVKTNIGHLEAAAGIASLIKVALQLFHEQLTPTLHYQALNPAADTSARSYEIVTRAQPWTSDAVAGVSSFGISGTNVHMVMTAPPRPRTIDSADGSPDRAEVLPISAASAGALQHVARRLAAHLEAASSDLQSVSRTLALGRRHFPYRRAGAARDVSEAIEQLQKIAATSTESRVPLRRSAPRIAFLFTGQGAQLVGMGRDLYRREPVFRDVVDNCHARLTPYRGARLLDVMFGEDQALLDQTAWAQPALFVFEYALATLWRSWGVVPVAAIGHSVGELAAACVAEVFSLEDALKLVASRGRLMQSLPGGEMIAANTGVETIERLVPLSSSLVISAINAPDRVVLSGSSSAVRAAADRLRGEGIRTTPLAVSHAFHSPLMEPMLDAFRMEAARTAFAPPRLLLYSTLTGGRAGDAMAAADYWCRQAREPVRFADSLDQLLIDGIDICLEIGPRPVLTSFGTRSPRGKKLGWLASVRSTVSEHGQMMGTLARLYEAGVDVNWAALHGQSRASHPDLPTYPFQRESYWLEADRDAAPRGAAAAAPQDAPLLGAPRFQPQDHGQRRFETILDAANLPALAGTMTTGGAVLPISAYIASAVALDRARGGEGAVAIERLHIAAALPLATPGYVIQTVLTPASMRDDGRDAASVFSRADGYEWTAHASWRYEAAPDPAPNIRGIALGPDVVSIDGPEFYRRVGRVGIEIGVPLRVVERVSFGRSSAAARLRCMTALSEGTALLPLFDGCFQVMAAALAGTGVSRQIQIDQIERIVWYGPPAGDTDIAVTWAVGHSSGPIATMTINDVASGSRVADVMGIAVTEIEAVPTFESGRSTVKDRLRAASEDEKVSLVTECLRDAVGGVLHLPAGLPIDPHLPFNLAGLDSLMALHLSMIIRRELDVQVSAASILDDGCVDALARTVVRGGSASDMSTPVFDVVAARFVDGEL